MKLSTAIKFLTEVQERDGDIQLYGVTGFWVRDLPMTGDRIVVPVIPRIEKNIDIYHQIESD